MSASGQQPGLTPHAHGDGKFRKRVKTIEKNAKFWIPFGALLATIWVATQGQISVNQNSRVTLRQSQDTQLSTAITAIGSSDTAEQIAGLLLLTQNTNNRFTLMGQSEEPAAAVFSDYTTALQILGGYLSSHGQEYLAGSTDSGANVLASFGPGYGVPPALVLPDGILYAADQVAALMKPEVHQQFAALNIGQHPAIDLSHDELFGQPWAGINFDGVIAYMRGIDLRGATLISSVWGARADLSGAYFQCADLQGANFDGANLSNADFEGAYVQGADFRGADIAHATFTQVYGTPRWSQRPAGTVSIPVSKFSPSGCEHDTSYWRGEPTVTSAGNRSGRTP